MDGLWIIWWIVLLLMILNMIVGSQVYLVFSAACFVILAIITATRTILEEIKNVRKD